MKPHQRQICSHRSQRGVVLIISLVMLVVITLLTVTSLRNVSTSENISSNVRTAELAQQSAALALRYCEASVIRIKNGDNATAADPIIHTAKTPMRWENVQRWDAPASDDFQVFAIPLSLLNTANLATTYQRSPECLVETMDIKDETGNLLPGVMITITARGFGPEVAAASKQRTAPQGSEVWLQSTLELSM